MADLARVELWARALIRMHLDETWTFAFDHAKKRAGLCNYSKKRISVSRYIAAAADDDDVHQTLLHEVAHAMAGHAAGHGKEWQAVARSIGYVGGRTYDGEIAREHARWLGTCPNGHEAVRFRRPTTRAVSCAKCSKTFDRRYLITWAAIRRGA